MSIAFRCTCGARFNLPDSKAGLKSKCPRCHSDLVVPSATTGPASEDLIAGRLQDAPRVQSSPPATQLISSGGFSHKLEPILPSPDVEGGWILNPGDVFPLTILGVDQSIALELKNLLQNTEMILPTGLFGSVAEMVARTGLRCKEIEDYVSQFRKTFDAGREPGISPYCDLDKLFKGRSMQPSVGDSLIRRYGFENLRFYSRHSAMVGVARPIPSTHRDRERFEALAQIGLATVGAPISHRGKTGEAFRLNRLDDGTGPDAIASWIGFCMAVAELLTLTYAHSASETRSAQVEADPDVKGYKVVTAGSLCRFCSRLDGRHYPVHSRPKVPFHIGCRCTLISLYR